MPCPDSPGSRSPRPLIHPHLDLLENIPGCDYLSAKCLPSSPLERPPGEAAIAQEDWRDKKGVGGGWRAMPKTAGSPHMGAYSIPSGHVVPISHLLCAPIFGQSTPHLPHTAQLPSP